MNILTLGCSILDDPIMGRQLRTGLFIGLIASGLLGIYYLKTQVNLYQYKKKLEKKEQDKDG